MFSKTVFEINKKLYIDSKSTALICQIKKICYGPFVLKAKK